MPTLAGAVLLAMDPTMVGAVGVWGWVGEEREREERGERGERGMAGTGSWRCLDIYEGRAVREEQTRRKKIIG